MRPINGKVRTPPNEYRSVSGFARFALQAGHERWEEDEQDFDALQRQQAIEVDEHGVSTSIAERGLRGQGGQGPAEARPLSAQNVRRATINPLRGTNAPVNPGVMVFMKPKPEAVLPFF